MRFWPSRKKPASEGLLSVAVTCCSVTVDEIGENNDAVMLCGFVTAYIESIGRSDYQFYGCGDDFFGILWAAISQGHPKLLNSFTLFGLSFVRAEDLLKKSHAAFALQDFLSDEKLNWDADRVELQEWTLTMLALVQTLISENAANWLKGK